jgi:hypothetical protein
VPFPQDLATHYRSGRGSDPVKAFTDGSRIVERMAREDLRWYLVNKYRPLLISKLTPKDLEEIQYYLRRHYDTKRGWDHEYVKKFIRKLKEYMPEEILKREIAGIETVLTLVKPGDLKKDSGKPESPLS